MGKNMFRTVQDGIRIKTSKKKWRDLNSQIQNLKNRFESRIIALDEYWPNMSHICQIVQ